MSIEVKQSLENKPIRRGQKGKILRIDLYKRQRVQLKKNWKSALNVKIQVCRFRVYHHVLVVFDVPEKYFLLLQN